MPILALLLFFLISTVTQGQKAERAIHFSFSCQEDYPEELCFYEDIHAYYDYYASSKTLVTSYMDISNYVGNEIRPTITTTQEKQYILPLLCWESFFKQDEFWVHLDNVQWKKEDSIFAFKHHLIKDSLLLINLKHYRKSHRQPSREAFDNQLYSLLHPPPTMMEHSVYIYFFIGKKLTKSLHFFENQYIGEPRPIKEWWVCFTIAQVLFTPSHFGNAFFGNDMLNTMIQKHFVVLRAVQP